MDYLNHISKPNNLAKMHFLDHGLLIHYGVAKPDRASRLPRGKLRKRLDLGIFSVFLVYCIGVWVIWVYLDDILLTILISQYFSIVFNFFNVINYTTNHPHTTQTQNNQ